MNGRSPSLDALLPNDMLERATDVGVAKANLPAQRLITLGVLGGAFIGLGAMFSIVVTAGPAPLTGTTRLLGGVAFALGLLLVVVGGAELFTGNNLLTIAFAQRRISVRLLGRNWLIVYAANLVGAIGTAALIFMTEQHRSGDGAIGRRVLEVAERKAAGGALATVASGIVANVLVCLAAWLSYSGRSVVDKAVAIVFPVSAFVAGGFEHSIANLYILPSAWMIKRWSLGDIGASGTGPNYVHIRIQDIESNVAAATVGNVIGGAVLVGLVYWLAYGRSQRTERTRN